MKFDSLAGGDPINANSYAVDIGYSAPSTPYKEGVIQHTFINGAINMIDVDTRNEEEAEFDIELLDKDEFLELESFLNDNSGKKVQITEENDMESFFTEAFSTPPFPFTYFAYLIEIGNNQEDQFSQKRKTFRLRVKIALSGLTSTDEINPEDLGNFNVLIKVNTTQAKFVDTVRPDVSDGELGTRWHDTTDDKVYEHQGENVFFPLLTDFVWTPALGGGSITPATPGGNIFAGYTLTPGDKIHLASSTDTLFIQDVYEIAEKIDDETLRLLSNNPNPISSVDIFNVTPWNKFLYDVPADIPSLGFVSGVFYWASFFTMRTASFPTLTTEMESQDWLSNIINYKSIKIKGQSVDINKGPSLFKRDGFSFSVEDADRFWKTIVDAGIPLFGATCEVSYFNKIGSALQIESQIAGKNITNSFSYTDYKFTVEPFLLNEQQDLPPNRISRDTQRYLNVRDDAVGKAPYLTYGEFDRASLQNISKVQSNVTAVQYRFPYDKATTPSNTTTSIRGFINTTTADPFIYINTRTVVKSEQDSQTDGYDITDEIINDINANGGYTIRVETDTNAPVDDGNIGEVRTITAITLLDSGWYRLTLDSLLPIIPSDTTPDPPSTDESITFFILNSTYEFQFNESPSGGFGLFDPDTKVYTPDVLRLFFLDENNKDLVELPPGNFKVNTPDNNKVSFSLLGVNDEGAIENFIRHGSDADNPIGQAEAIVTEQDGLTFNNGDGTVLAPPDVWTPNVFEKTPQQTQPTSGNPPNSDKTDSSDYPNFERAPAQYNAYLFPDNVSDPLRYHRIFSYTSGFAPDGSPFFKPEDGMLRGIFSFVGEDFAERATPSFTPVFQDGIISNSMITALRFPVSPTDALTAGIPLDEPIKLTVNFEINMRVRTDVDQYGGSLNPDTGRPFQNPKFVTRNRHYNGGIKIIMRAVTNTGGFIYNGWEHAVTAKQMGAGTNNQDISGIIINNMPQDGNFEDTTILTDNFDFDVDQIFDTELDRDSYCALVSRGNGPNFPINQQLGRKILGNGWKCYVKLSNMLYTLIGDGESNTFGTGSPNFKTPDFIFDAGELISVDSILRHRKFTYVSDSEPSPNEVLMFKVKNSFLVDAVEDLDFKVKPVLSGKDLFDISNLFLGPNPLWPSVVAFEFNIVNNDFAASYSNTGNRDLLTTWAYTNFTNAHIDWKFPFTPRIYGSSSFKIQDRPMFSAVQGKLLPDATTFPSNPEPIIRDVMESMFPGKTDFASITALMALSGRGEWLWRRQFVDAMNSDDVMMELMQNLWAVITINDDDKFEFNSLYPTDYDVTNPNQQFNDSNVLKDSIKNPKFRKTNDIYQRYELSYNFDPVSDFTSSVPAWRNVDLLADVPQSTATSRQKSEMNSSLVLYGVRNIFKRNYKYHYDGNELPIRDMVQVHYTFNAWIVKLTGSIQRLLGPDKLKVMSFISWTSFFHTGGETTVGFVTDIKPDPYTQTAVFTLFIPRPPGYLGPLCDPFNDAYIAGRDTSLFPINDAGLAGRTTGSYTQKDAGLSPRGTIDCS